MKTILMLSVLFTFVACNGGGGSDASHSKKCTLNDQPVDCKEFESQTTNVSTQRSNMVTLEVKAVTELDLRENYFQILKDAEQVKTTDIKGETYFCSVQTPRGKFYDYELNGDELILVDLDSNESVTLERMVGSSGELNGVWSVTEVVEGMTFKTVMTFKDSRLTVNVTCGFKK